MENLNATELLAREEGQIAERWFWLRLELALRKACIVYGEKSGEEFPTDNLCLLSPTSGESPLQTFFKHNADALTRFLPEEFAVVHKPQLAAVLKASIPVGQGDPKLFSDMLLRDASNRLEAVCGYTRQAERRV